MKNKARPIVGFAQLCIITREQIEADPTVDNFEWKERIKRRLLSLGFTYPAEPDTIDRALHAVERALAKAGRTRPGPAPASAPPQPDAMLERPLSRDEARAFLADVAARAKIAKPIRTIPKVPSITPHQAAVHRASEIVAREIVESIARCEAAERAIVDEAPKP